MSGTRVSRRIAVCLCVAALLAAAVCLHRSQHALGPDARADPFVPEPPISHVAPLRHVEFSPDSRFLLTQSTDHELILWDARRGHKLRTVLPATQPERFLGDSHWSTRFYRLNRAGNAYWMGVLDDDQGWIQLRGLLHDNLLRVFELEQPQLPQSVHVTFDEQYLVAHADALQVWEIATSRRIWDANQGRKTQARIEAAFRQKHDVVHMSIGAHGAAVRLRLYEEVRPDGQPLRFPGQAYIVPEGSENRFSPNGGFYVTRYWSDTSSSDEDVMLWNADSGIRLTETSRPYRERRHLEFVPDDQTYIERGDSPLDVDVRRSATNELVHRLSHEHDVVARALAPDGRTCLTGTQGGAVHLWELQTGQKLRQVDLQAAEILTLEYRHDARQFLVGAKHGNARTFELPSGAPAVTLAGDARHPTNGRASYSPDGSRIVIHTEGNAFLEASLWNAMNGERLRSLARPPTHTIELSPNGRWALTLPLNVVLRGYLHSEHTDSLRTVPRQVTLWETANGKRLHQFPDGPQQWDRTSQRPPQMGRVGSAPTSTLNPTLIPTYQASQSSLKAILHPPTDLGQVSGLDNVGRDWLMALFAGPAVEQSTAARVLLKRENSDGSFSPMAWNTQTWNPVVVLEEAGQIIHKFAADGLIPTAATLNHDQSRVLVAYHPTNNNTRVLQTKTLILWDMQTGARLRTIDAAQSTLAPSSHIRALAFSPDDRHVALGFDHQIFVMQFDTGQITQVADVSGYSLPTNTEFVRFDPTSRRLICLGGERVVWDIPDRRKLAELGRGHRTPLFSPNGMFFGLFEKRDCRLWNSQTGQPLRLKEKGYHAGLLTASPDGTRLVCPTVRQDVTTQQPTLALWDFQSGTELTLLLDESNPREGIRDVVFSPDGQLLVTVYPNRLAVWDSESGALLSEHRDSVHEFDYSGNSQSPFFVAPRKLIAVHATGATYWDITESRLIRDFPMPRARHPILLMNTERTQLLTVSPGREAIFWELATGRRLQTFRQIPSDLVARERSLRFSHDESLLFAHHHRGSAVTVWDTATGRLRERYNLIDHGRRWIAQPGAR